MAIKVSSIANEISKQLATYSNEVSEGLEKVKEEVSKDTVKLLKGLNHPKLTGDYAKGWRVKRVGNALIIHNKTNYQLTHLLEKGHAKRGGGRVAAIPHIGPAEEKAIEEYVSKAEKVIKR